MQVIIVAAKYCKSRVTSAVNGVTCCQKWKRQGSYAASLVEFCLPVLLVRWCPLEQ